MSLLDKPRGKHAQGTQRAETADAAEATNDESFDEKALEQEATEKSGVEESQSEAKEAGEVASSESAKNDEADSETDGTSGVDAQLDEKSEVEASEADDEAESDSGSENEADSQAGEKSGAKHEEGKSSKGKVDSGKPAKAEADSTDSDDDGAATDEDGSSDKPKSLGKHSAARHAAKGALADTADAKAPIEGDALRPEQFSDAPTQGVYGTPLVGAAPYLGTMDPEKQAGFVAAAYGEVRAKRRRRALKAFGITAGVIIAVLMVVYIAGAVVFMGRFLPNTNIGGKDISLKTDAEVAELLGDIVEDYQLDVVGGGFSYRLTSSDIGFSIDANQIVKAIHDDLSAWSWPLLVLTPNHNETHLLSISYKRDTYEPGLTEEINKFNETAKDPVNATIVYDGASGRFVIQPEVAGTKLNTEVVLASVKEAIDELESKVTIGEDHVIKPTVYSTDEKLKAAAEQASNMVKAHMTLIMGGQNVGEVDGAMLSGFVTVNDKFEVTFREEELNAWVEELARSFDTVGTERVYTRPDGKTIAVSGGVYGWEVDSEALRNAILDGVWGGTVGELEVPCLSTAQVYNGPNQPDWGARYIDVDISEQYVRFYGDDGSIIWEAPCISGMPDGKHDTVPGVWSVNAKESPSKLIGYENGQKIYETMVTYWMPFEGNGIGFHDATWQPGFGGSMYANGYGSHGCVNLSYADAQSLYGIIQHDDVVVVHG